KQGHFEMGIRYANFMPISNHFARKRAALCPLTKCYQEGCLNYIFGDCKISKAAAAVVEGIAGEK
ncbi:hypothetical protein, partial [Plesiomonas shigelloides]